MKKAEQEVLERLKRDIAASKNKSQLLNIFRKLVVLEYKCLQSKDKALRTTAYQAQILQADIETKIIIKSL